MNIKALFILAIVTVVSSYTSAKNFTQENIEKANAVIERVAAAYGGKDKLQGLETLAIHYDVVNINAGQSRGTEPPWDQSKGAQTSAFNFKTSEMMSLNFGQGGGNVFHSSTIIKEGKAQQIDHRRRTIAKLSTADFNQRAGPGVRIMSTLLAKQLMTHADSARFLGKQKIGKIKTQVISFDMNMGPAITLYVEKSGRILKSERVVGPFLVEYFFENHARAEGYEFPEKMWYTVNDDPSQEFHVTDIKFNQIIDTYTATPKGYTFIDTPPTPGLKVHTLADNIYWVTNAGANNLFIKDGNQLISVGGLENPSERLKALREEIGDIPLKHALLTHHHNDHISGVAELAKENAKIYTVKNHARVVKDAAGDTPVNLVFVDRKLSVKNDTTAIDVYDVGPTPHAEHYLLVHLPEHGIMFDADHFMIPATGPMPPVTENVKFLVTTIRNLDLNIKTIVSAHASRLATYEDLINAYNTPEKTDKLTFKF